MGCAHRCCHNKPTQCVVQRAHGNLLKFRVIRAREVQSVPMSNRSVRFHPFLVHAVKHGAFAKTAILPGEDPQEFEELHSALIEEWAPVGPTEEDAVLSIAKGVWRKGRAQKFRHAEVEMCRYNPEHRLYDQARGLGIGLNNLETELDQLDSCPDAF